MLSVDVLRERAPRAVRRVTSRLRRLPDAIIVGAQKAGTSSLYAYMAQHPSLLPSSAKEVHFFDGGPGSGRDSFRKGPSFYRSYFPLRRGFGGSDELAFEASPLYLFHPQAPLRIAHLLPQVKIIVLLRDPVRRAISHYFHEVAAGRESWPMHDALVNEEERLNNAPGPEAWEEIFKRHSYKRRGLYAEQLQRYFYAFPRRQVLILRAEDLFKRTEATLVDVFQFLGVDPTFLPADLTVKNSGKIKQVVPDASRDYLEAYFEEPNRELQRLVGDEMTWGRR
jgi:hypothetical protein